MSNFEVLEDDCLDVMRGMDGQSVHCCVTSPPYYGLRNYNCDGQIGLEKTPDAYVAALVDVFREVRRVLRDDGTVWLNLGDSYANNSNGSNPSPSSKLGSGPGGASKYRDDCSYASKSVPPGLKPKDLIGIPWRVAFALQANGWWLRQDIIWHKPSPMPESVTDRCTKAHEYIFLLSKSARYYYDADAVRNEPSGRTDPIRSFGKCADRQDNGRSFGLDGTKGANRRSVWTVATKPYKGAHFATFPPKLIEPCILAGCPAGGTVLDPFTGSGTTGMVAVENGRNFIGSELNPEYAAMARQRIREAAAQPDMFTHHEDNP